MTGRHTRHIVLAVFATMVLSAASCAPQEPPTQDPPPQEPPAQELTREEIENLGIDDLRAQAEQGNALAQTKLGQRYESGEGVVKNGTEAVRWYVLAAEQGDGGAKDLIEGAAKRGDDDAFKWIRTAAARGEAKAQYLLGSFYAAGSLVQKNYNTSQRWYLLAAEQDFVPAQVHFGRLHLGAGDLVQAHMWFNIAAARETRDDRAVLRFDELALSGPIIPNRSVSQFDFSGLTPLQPLPGGVPGRAYLYSGGMRDRVALDMTPDQIAEAERLALEWESRQRQPSEPQEEVAPSNSPNTLSDELGEAVKGIVELMANDPESSVATKEDQAAELFWGYYLKYTRGIARYCEGLSVNMDEFVGEFTERHSAEIEKATASLARHGRTPETLWQGLRQGIAVLLAQEGQDISEKVGVSPREQCAVLSADPESTVTGMHFSSVLSTAHKLLMGGSG